jgi:5'-nucleotidase
MTQKYDLLNEEPVIKTYSRKWVNVFEPTLDMFCIEDVAHALSHQCRFGGHLSPFYSVAQHSILCAVYAEAQGLDKKEQLTALMHDSSEAYLVDIPRPIKKRMPEYKLIEDKLMIFLATAFKFNYPLSEHIHAIDNIMLQNEWDNIMIKRDDINPFNRMHVYSIEYAEQLFLDMYKMLSE